MLEEEANKLLSKEWIEEEKDIVQRMIKNLLYYKKLLPKSLKQDVLAALRLCNSLKDKLDDLSKGQETLQNTD